MLQAQGPRWCNFHSLMRSVGVQAAAAAGCTTIELIGEDRPGLFSQVFADIKCNAESAEVWTHNSRTASVVYITDEVDRYAICSIPWHHNCGGTRGYTGDPQCPQNSV
ncbi:hypothetical protein POM88_036668 [Heracleum sosnowskyi]|uniref:ACT domain-containing protein ACR n=1 Tax=Heracleum sosnowskyi TaxID=360622 RepID=A0AAD8MEI8_9APIA|nr:hypothetical protein POM88_036668 [Heracleum sosnowskyi]